MSKPTIIGITGGIGSGKSTLSALLMKQGFLVYNTDDAGRRLQQEDKDLICKIQSVFGDDIYSEGLLDRKRLASIVFSDPDALMKLTSLVHPAVKRDFQNWVSLNSEQKILFMECAILFEGAFDILVDKIVSVTANTEIRIQRVIKRDGLDRKEVLDRMNNQVPEDERIRRSQFIFITDDNVALDIKLKRFLEKIN